MVSATTRGVFKKKDEYFAKTPRLMHENVNNDAGNWNLSNLPNREG